MWSTFSLPDAPELARQKVGISFSCPKILLCQVQKSISHTYGQAPGLAIPPSHSTPIFLYTITDDYAIQKNT